MATQSVANRIVIAHDLPMDASEVGRQLNALSAIDDGWYLPRDPAAQIEELLAMGSLTIGRHDGRVKARLHLTKPIDAEADDVQTALLDLYRQVRGEDG